MRAISAVVGLAVLLAAVTAAQDTGRASPSLLKASFSKLPIYFVENRGLYPDDVAYYVQGADKTLFFTKDGITFRLKGRDKGWVVKLEFVGANRNVKPRGEDPQQAVFSYFRGPEKDWRTGLSTYAKVVYEDLWPGIDLVYRGTVNRLKYEFVVRPGAEPGEIRLRYRGATELALTESDGLRLETPVGSFEDSPPVAWQEIEGKRVRVAIAYRLDTAAASDEAEFGFDLGSYDLAHRLVLDPAVLVYGGYIGGGLRDRGLAIALDSAGNAYVTGATQSTETTFPVKVGPDLTYNGFSAHTDDAFVAKVNAQGTALLYCGYIGGLDDDLGLGIAVDPAGNAYVTGSSESPGLPVKVGPDLKYKNQIGGPVPFVAKINAKGTALEYCGYIGGSQDGWGRDIAVDPAGNAYVVGETYSDEKSFPVKVGPDLTFNNATRRTDAFVAKVNPSGTGLVYCGYIGGADYDSGDGVAVDGAGCAYVTGGTESDEKSFPVRVGPDLTFNSTILPSGDAFVAKVNAQGSALVYCGYIGGSSGEGAAGIDVDRAGSAYVTGTTVSSDLPVKVGPDLTYNGGQGDAFVAKVNAQGSALVYCGYIGGSSGEGAAGIAVDAAGSVYVTGETDSKENTFPVRIGPDLTQNDVTGYGDAFVVKVALATIRGSGSTRPGGRVDLDLAAGQAAGLPYQIGTSLGTGPIPIDTRQIDLSPDNLLLVTVNNYWPSVFAGYRGVIDSMGQAQAAIHIPNVAALVGVRLHSAFVTLDPAAPSGIRSISEPFSFSITK